MDIEYFDDFLSTALFNSVFIVLTLFSRKHYVFANLYNSTAVRKNLTLPPEVQKREFSQSEIIIHPKLNQIEFKQWLLGTF